MIEKVLKPCFVKSIMLCIITFGSIIACQKPETTKKDKMLFSNISSDKSGIYFKNIIKNSKDFHYYKYIYSYNGSGVAAADFNNDGFIDLFFTANTSDHKLYINKGSFEFEDITAASGIKKLPGFATGVLTLDINQDGYLDIYICRAGWYDQKDTFSNLLYINNGDLTFTEKAEDYGLADIGRSFMATTLDYDKDGDLDLYIVNAPLVTKDYRKLFDLKEVQKNPNTLALGGSDKLLRNDGQGNYKDVSAEAGIYIERAFGLHAQVADLNHDNWLDIYVSNDFEMPDFAYINNRDGTFTDQSQKMFKHVSFYSMGADVGDINNDGLQDIVVLDMNPEDYVRSKTTMAMTSMDKFQVMINNDYQYQYMHNMLQINTANDTFSEIAQMAGIANTDWSWTPLLADYDLDGFTDLFVTNGIYRDVIDQDINKKIIQKIRQKGKRPTDIEYATYANSLPQNKIHNYIFKNLGDLTFKNVSSQWADMSPTFSNGAVYADLDNDGDLDVAINNINDTATLLKNNAIEQSQNNYLNFTCKGPKNNQFGIGTSIKIWLPDNTILYKQLLNARGYLSSGSNRLYFGIGKHKTVKKIVITWSDGATQELENIEANQLVTLSYQNTQLATPDTKVKTQEKLFEKEPSFLKHKDSVFNDYDLQLLLPHKLSQLGPAFAIADINNDGLDDIFLGGGFDQSGQLLKGTSSGTFEIIKVPELEIHKKHEDISAVFFDADNDKDLDLYVVSGSYEFNTNSPLLQDRLYINTGKENFNYCNDCLPEMKVAGSVVVPLDFDQDGDLDLFVGGRLIPGKYPYAPISTLLENRNKNFVDVTLKKAPQLRKTGMVTDAKSIDIDDDGDLDLIVTGEWMGINVFENSMGHFSLSEKYPDLSNTKGWWNKILIKDIDGDNDLDIIAGNLGLNYKYQATQKKPFHIYTDDFDDNNTEDIVLAKYYKNKQVPVRGKNCTAQQIPYLNDKIKNHHEFANQDLEGIIGKSIKVALHYEANEFRSGIFYQDHGNFSFKPFPNEVQIAPVNSILYQDIDQDGIKDLLLAGNNYQSEIETTRADAGIGSFLKGMSDHTFSWIPNTTTGFYADRDVRNLGFLKTIQGDKILVINNNEMHDLYNIINSKK